MVLPVNTRRTSKRPWRLVKSRLGLTVDVWATYASKEAALKALPKHRLALRKIGGRPHELYVLDPSGARVEESAC